MPFCLSAAHKVLARHGGALAHLSNQEERERWRVSWHPPCNGVYYDGTIFHPPTNPTTTSNNHQTRQPAVPTITTPPICTLPSYPHHHYNPTYLPPPQESLEDVGTAASRLGTTLLSSLAFAKLSKSSASLKSQAASEDGGGGGSGSATTAAAVAHAAEEVAEAAAEEAGARRMAGTKSAPAMGAGRAAQEAGKEVLEFGAVDQASAGGGNGALSAETPAERAELSQSPCRATPAQLRQGGPVARAGGRTSSLGHCREGAAGIARVADGAALPGSKFAQGRLDFVMQVCGQGPAVPPASCLCGLPCITARLAGGRWAAHAAIAAPAGWAAPAWPTIQGRANP